MWRPADFIRQPRLPQATKSVVRIHRVRRGRRSINRVVVRNSLREQLATPRIVLCGDRQDRLQPAGDLRISRSKKLDMVPAPIQLLAEVVDDALRSAMRFRRNGDIHAGDLSDLHDGAPDSFYTCKNVRQDACVQSRTGLSYSRRPI